MSASSASVSAAATLSITNKELYDLRKRLDNVDDISSKDSEIEEELTKQIPNKK